MLNISTYHYKGTSDKNDIYDFCESDEKTGIKVKTSSNWQLNFSHEVQRIKLGYSFLPINLVKARAKKLMKKSAIKMKRVVPVSKASSGMKVSQRKLDFMEEQEHNFEEDRSAIKNVSAKRQPPKRISQKLLTGNIKASRVATSTSKPKAIISRTTTPPRERSPEPKSTDNHEERQTTEVTSYFEVEAVESEKEVTLPQTTSKRRRADDRLAQILKKLGGPVPATEKVRKWLSKIHPRATIPEEVTDEIQLTTEKPAVDHIRRPNSILKSGVDARSNRDRSFRVQFVDETTESGKVESIETTPNHRIVYNRSYEQSASSSESDEPCPLVSRVGVIEPEVEPQEVVVVEQQTTFEQPPVPTRDQDFIQPGLEVFPLLEDGPSTFVGIKKLVSGYGYDRAITKTVSTVCELGLASDEESYRYVPIRNVSVTGKAGGGRKPIQQESHLRRDGDHDKERNADRRVSEKTKKRSFGGDFPVKKAVNSKIHSLPNSSTVEDILQVPDVSNPVECSPKDCHGRLKRRKSSADRLMNRIPANVIPEINLRSVVGVATADSSLLWSWLIDGSSVSASESSDDDKMDNGSGEKAEMRESPSGYVGDSFESKSSDENIFQPAAGSVDRLKDITNGSKHKLPNKRIEVAKSSAAQQREDTDRNFALCNMFPPANSISKGGTIKRFLDTKAKPETFVTEWEDPI